MMVTLPARNGLTSPFASMVARVVSLTDQVIAPGNPSMVPFAFRTVYVVWRSVGGLSELS